MATTGGLETLQEVLAELFALGADSPVPVPPPPEPAPALPEVLLSLGYLVELQERPEAAAALSAGAGQSALKVLRAVVKQHLARQAADEQSVSGFYDRASQHLRRLGVNRPK